MLGVEIGGHAAKRNGHAVEIQVLAVVDGHIGEQELIDAAIGEEGVVQAQSVKESDGKGLRHLVLVLPATIAEIGIRRGEREDAHEGVTGSDGTQLGGRIARSV